MKLKVYSHLILQKIVVGVQKLYKKRDFHKRWLITQNILFKLILKFNKKTFKKANLYIAFYLTFAKFLHIGKFTYNKIKNNFSL